MAGIVSPRSQVRGVPEGLTDFKPRGVLVAHMAEHQHRVNSLAVSSSRSSWIASASSDGTVMLWGGSRDGVQIDKVRLPQPIAVFALTLCACLHSIVCLSTQCTWCACLQFFSPAAAATVDFHSALPCPRRAHQPPS
jgi:WD40 repeat protein